MKKVSILASIAIAAGLASCTAQAPKPVFKTELDSLAYAMGMSNTQGLKPYIAARMNVDTTYMGEFINGFLESVKESKPQDVAYQAGMQIGSQVANQILPGASHEIFGMNAKDSINKTSFVDGFIAGTMGEKGKMTADEAMAYTQKVMAEMRTQKMAADSTDTADKGMDKAKIDSISYAIGMANSQGLKPYLAARLNVDTTYMSSFVKGFKETVKGASAAKVAHMAGMQIGSQVINQIIPGANNQIFANDSVNSLNKDNFVAGFVAGATGKDEQMTMSFASEFTSSTLEKIQSKKLEAEFADNKAAGEAFLTANAQKEGVVTLPSGLQFRILKEGKGAIPQEGDMVKVHYAGTLIDGTEFDSSYSRNEPATFRTNQVIQGWQEALTKMPIGSEWELVIPQDLAYGSRNTGTIKPFSTLVFKVELLGIESDKK